MLLFVATPATLLAQSKADGDGSVTLSDAGRWHPMTLSIAGPYADEQQDLGEAETLNPFLDYRMEVEFSQGDSRFTVPGYFAADGQAAESSATSGNIWRAHFSPPSTGSWNYRVLFCTGDEVAINEKSSRQPVASCHLKKGSFEVSAAQNPSHPNCLGMLLPKDRHLRFPATDSKPFFKVGPDSPETLLAFEDFDGTETRKEKKGPLKSWEKHLADSDPQDPTWQNGKGQGLLGALNYLGREKGINAISFLTYNVDGDGDNVWPHVSATDKRHMDCSKLDQWGRVFEHAQNNGLLLHFKLQETENDDWRGKKDKDGKIAGALDGGKCGSQRKLYLRELVARFGHFNRLEWNLGEENTQSFAEQQAMAQYLVRIDAYGHNVVLHTYPKQQDKVYQPWLGKESLTGVSLQNDWKAVHKLTLKWVQLSQQSDRPWVVANDEQGPANLGVPPDPGYNGFSGKAARKPKGDDKGTGKGRIEKGYTLHDIRKQVLWGNLMAGGAGVMYYFGYQLDENDLACQDFRSRDQSWDYCRVALECLNHCDVGINELENRNALVGNAKNAYAPWCLARPGQLYLVYLPEGGTVTVDLSGERAEFAAFWFDPEKGGPLSPTAVATQKASCEFDAGGVGKDRVLILKAK